VPKASKGCPTVRGWTGSPVAARDAVAAGGPAQLESSLGEASRVEQNARAAAVANAANTAVSRSSTKNMRPPVARLTGRETSL
jgi:hypothetical protein